MMSVICAGSPTHIFIHLYARYGWAAETIFFAIVTWVTGLVVYIVISKIIRFRYKIH